MSNSTINIYYSINTGKMFKQTLVSLISLCETNKENILNVWVLDCEVPEYSPKIKKLSNEELSILQDILTNANPNNKLHYYDVSDLLRKYMLGGINESKDSWLKGYSFISMLFIRYLIPFIPNIPNKMLWLDSDTIIMKDLTELWNIDIFNYEWGGCKDRIHVILNTFFKGATKPLRKKWLQKIYGIFLQNGVMLLNLDKNSPNNILDSFRSIILNYKHENYYFADEVNVIENKLIINNKFNSFQPAKTTYIFHVCTTNATNTYAHKFQQMFKEIKIKKYQKTKWIVTSDKSKCDKAIKTDDKLFYECYKQFRKLRETANKYLKLINDEI